MIAGERVLAVIPARGGSKGVPGKNTRLLAGKPLLAWTIEAARNAAAIDRLILSSEDAGIIATARQWQCEVPFVRPSELAGDLVSATQVAIHAVEQLPGYDWVVLLQPTSPFRTAQDIDDCLQRAVTLAAPGCLTVAEVGKSPCWYYTLAENGTLTPWLADYSGQQRQQLPRLYLPNGAVYAARCAWLCRTRSFVGSDTQSLIMPAERSLDIDTAFDWQVAASLMAANRPDAIP